MDEYRSNEYGQSDRYTEYHDPALEQKPKNGWGIASLILGIASISPGSIVCGILAIVFGNKQNAIWPNGMSKAGRICGIVGIVVTAVVSLISMILMVALDFSLIAWLSDMI